MQCPVDNTRLTINERQGVEIDYCPTCRGVWLDRGELDKLIARDGDFSQRRDEREDRREEQRDDSRDRRSFSDDDDNDEYRGRDNNSQQGGKRHKKEGFLGDLFDF